MFRLTRPSPSLVVACLALFVALAGTSVAAVSPARPAKQRRTRADPQQRGDKAQDPEQRGQLDQGPEPLAARRRLRSRAASRRTRGTGRAGRSSRTSRTSWAGRQRHSTDRSRQPHGKPRALAGNDLGGSCRPRPLRGDLQPGRDGVHLRRKRRECDSGRCHAVRRGLGGAPQRQCGTASGSRPSTRRVPRRIGRST